MVTTLEAGTGRVVTLKPAVIAPAGTVTLAGSVVATAALLLRRETRAPPLGACVLNVTIPVEGDPPLTLIGFNLSEMRVGCGVTVSEADWVKPA